MTRVTQTCTCSPFRKKCRPGLGRGFRASSSDPLRISMTTPTSPGSSQRAMDVVFASLVSQLQPKLREALVSSGLDDPGLLRAYPRSPVEDLRAMGLGMAVVTSTSSSSFPPSVSSSLYSGVEGTVSRPSTILSQGQGTVGTVPEMCKKAAVDLSLHTTSTLRPRGPERRRIMKKGSTLQTGVTDGSHVLLDGWTHISSSSTVSPTFSPCLLGSSSHVSGELAASSEVGGTSQSDPQGPLISADHVETLKSPLKSDVSQSRDLHGTSAGSTVELEVRGNSSLLQQVSSPTCSAQDQWTDEVILYFTLVADKVIPDGFLSDFLHLSQWISSAAHRQAARLARVTDVEAALFVHSVQTKVKVQALEQKAAVDTLVAAASFPPTRYKSRLHFAKFQGPAARKDAEESERQRWLQLFVNFIVGTDILMGNCSSHGKATYPCWVLGGELGHCGTESEIFGTSLLGLPLIIALHIPRNRHI